jgi:hypothetical protein
MECARPSERIGHHARVLAEYISADPLNATGHLRRSSSGKRHEQNAPWIGAFNYEMGTRSASVLVFPDPAPAMIRRETAETPSTNPTRCSCSTALRCCSFSFSRLDQLDKCQPLLTSLFIILLCDLMPSISNISNGNFEYFRLFGS